MFYILTSYHFILQALSVISYQLSVISYQDDMVFDFEIQYKNLIER
jgi:hypothetical protein